VARVVLVLPYCDTRLAGFPSGLATRITATTLAVLADLPVRGCAEAATSGKRRRRL
jgi:hypothetical protein